MLKRKMLHRAMFERKNDPADGNGGGNGSSALLEVKNLLDKQGQAWEEFKKTNDELIKAKADGKAVADLETKLDKIGKDLDKMSSMRDEIDALTLKSQRPSADAEDPKTLAQELKAFNIHRKSFANAPVADVSLEEYTAYKSAYWKLARKGNPDMLSDGERKAMQAGSDSDGGYLLPTPTVGRVVSRIFELSPIRQLADVQTISTDALEGVLDNDESSYGWVSETGTRSDTTTPQVGKYRIEAFEMYAMPNATQKLLDDAAVDIEAWLAGKVSNKFARVEGAAFINGTGVGQPRGFATYATAQTDDSSRPWGTIQTIKTGVSSDFAASTPADILFDLIQAFKSAYLQSASFVTRREVIAKIRKFKESTTNAYIWQPGLQQGQPDRLLGYPVTIAQDIPALASGSLSLWLGDWKEAYTIVDRQGIRTLRDPYTNKPYVRFYSTKRVGGGVLNFEALKAIQFGT